MPVLISQRMKKWTVPDKNGCLLWIGATTKGYGVITIGGRAERAHVVAYMLDRGMTERPALNVLHTCDRPACVNPEHLYLGSQADNVRDMMERGRGRAVLGERNAAKTRCKWGHEFTPENTRLRVGRGGRVCRKCAAYRARHK